MIDKELPSISIKDGSAGNVPILFLKEKEKAPLVLLRLELQEDPQESV
jgi:hypothetical protein